MLPFHSSIDKMREVTLKNLNRVYEEAFAQGNLTAALKALELLLKEIARSPRRVLKPLSEMSLEELTLLAEEHKVECWEDPKGRVED
jgi:hypothetical protein